MKTIRLLTAAMMLFAVLPRSVASAMTNDSHRRVDNLRGDLVYIPQNAPDVGSYVAAAYNRIFIDGQLQALIALYDDPRTERPIDYAEMYENDGDLLGIAWYDGFGILRIAVDHGLTTESPEHVSGVLLFDPDGDSV